MDDETIARLRREMKAPSLQELVEQFGTYPQITPEAWADFDRRMAEWKERLRTGAFYRPPYGDLPPEAKGGTGPVPVDRPADVRARPALEAYKAALPLQRKKRP